MNDQYKWSDKSNPPRRLLTWHIHGSYLYYLTQALSSTWLPKDRRPYEIYLPVKLDRPEGYGGRSGSFQWGENVHDVPASQVRDLELDGILFQSRKNYFEDQFEILTERQRALPKIYLEHDPPREHPTDSRHWVDTPEVLLVHVTDFNALMWNSGRSPTRVIDHGVWVPDDAVYQGDIERGIVVVNNIHLRGRRLGLDIFERVRQRVPLDIVGIHSEEVGGLGSIDLEQLPYLEARYRFFFNPIRYTSLGLAVCEAMSIGLPVVGLATTEMVTAVENGVSGYVDTNIDRLVDRMHFLLENPGEAWKMSQAARERALQRFHIRRFGQDWDDAIQFVTRRHSEDIWFMPARTSSHLGEYGPDRRDAENR
jgi:glycosyltransferase involved in cell wall biosynthesis